MVSGESMKFYEHLLQDLSAPSAALVEPLPQSFNLIWFLFLPCGFYATIQYHTGTIHAKCRNMSKPLIQSILCGNCSAL